MIAPAASHDLVVIGASAGGVEVLRRVATDLPPDLAACVCVVLHIAPSSPSALPRILERAGRLPCRAAADGEPLAPGQILVAPPDHHLVIADGRLRLTVGPRENGHRPSIDALFRSAAKSRGSRVIGVILSGSRDDGAAGLAVIRANGGAVIVQDPRDAMYEGMPTSALAAVQADAVVPSDRMAEVVVAMVNGQPLPPGTDPPAGGDRPGPGQAPAGDGTTVTTVCPECGGVLSERDVSGIVQWECRVGHRYSPHSLLNAQAEDVEAAMWAAVRALEDRQIMMERMAARFENRDRQASARSMWRRAGDAADQARTLREALARAAVTSLRALVEDGAEGDMGQRGAAEEGLAS